MQLQSSKQKNINNFYFACTNGIAFRNKSQSIVEEDLAKKNEKNQGCSLQNFLISYIRSRVKYFLTGMS
jgi:hypothetical protein